MESAYERARRANIARNESKLRELNLGALWRGARRQAEDEAALRRQRSSRRRQGSKRKRAAELAKAPKRRSRRVKRMDPPPLYTPVDATGEKQDEERRRGEEVAQGWRDGKSGLWRGERFGEVPGVPAGTVFGAGDFQRQGRFDMARTGFFKPVVTPEWIDNDTKEVFAVVINNDNGMSNVSRFDVIEYAGAGGRHRGQNRTAEQSFHQTWKSATNAALRRNQISGRPVRVIRGPKCRGPHGTAKSGGGYRYDGLYRVEVAELREMGRRRLKTAMFTLRRI
jgi:hypothetical protein